MWQPKKSRTEQDQKQAGGGKNRDVERRLVPPAPERLVPQLYDRELDIGFVKIADRGDRLVAVIQGYGQRAGRCAEADQGLARPDDLIDGLIQPFGMVGRSGLDPPISASQQYDAAIKRGARRQACR